MAAQVIVFIHGYSVTNLETYGELPLRIRREAQLRNLDIQTADLYLGRYVSFRDEVVLADVARALEAAVDSTLSKQNKHIFITHSTGGPLVRLWWHMFYQTTGKACPMSHLIMLAPANFGSSLAQLGKNKLGRLKSFLEGMEPGQGILNWLELGSNAAIDLNRDWIENSTNIMQRGTVFPFVLTGQSIDRKMYDHINSYTGEVGTDGVIRTSSANLNARYVKLSQQNNTLAIVEEKTASTTAFKILKNKSHSGDKMGIMRSVRKNDDISQELIDDIFSCIAVTDVASYANLCSNFEIATAANRQQMRLETEEQFFGIKHYVHDACCQVIVRVSDNRGNALNDFDIVFTGQNNEPDYLPEGFLIDRQNNSLSRNTLSFYFNYDLMFGCEAVVDTNGTVIRPAKKGLTQFGIKIVPRPARGFVRYQNCSIAGDTTMLKRFLQLNSTTIVDIELTRLLSNETLQFEKLQNDTMPQLSFKDIEPGDEVVI